MSDPNEEEATLVHQKIVPQKIQPDQNQQPKKTEPPKKGQSDNQSSLLKSQSDDSLRNKVNLGDSILEEEHKSPELQEKPKIADDFYYAAEHLENTYDQSPIPDYVVKMDGFFGHDSFKRYNAQVLDRDTIIYASGISYTIYNHFTKEKLLFFSRDGGGIAAIAVHPAKTHFAVAEKGVFPNIYIFEYPSLKLYRILRKGTQLAYSAICFSHSGEMMASVGSNPDYMLNVWDWKQQQSILKSKAFSQQVYRVNFSQFNEKWITTSGTGHIRFWRISQTFTGLKLQGEIAKFGLIELSDVCSFAEFEDGKVLSSSQYGKLLLWEGNLIKSVIGIDESTPCHNGAIEYVKLLGDSIITSGEDGYIKFWDYQTINTGESDEKFNFYLKPLKHIYFESVLKGPAFINWIEITKDYWVIQDALGKIWKYNETIKVKQEIISFNAGKIHDLALSPLNNGAITVGFDGSIRLWDYGNRKQFYARYFGPKVQSTCVEWLPFSKRNGGRMIVAGFSDGIVRFLLINQKQFLLLKAFKAHKNPITKIKANRDGSIIVVSDKVGCLFFFSVEGVNTMKPYCLFETGFKINDMCWDRKGQKILVGCQDGKIHEINVPKQSECDWSETYLKNFQFRTFTIKMMASQKPNRQDLELELLLKKTKGGNVDDIIIDEQWQPAPILNAIYYDTDCTKVLCSVEGKFLGQYYIVDMSKERPIGSIESSKIKTSFLGIVESLDLILIGLRNGTWEIRHKLNNTLFLRKACYDQNYGVVKKLAINIENTVIVSVSQDGTMMTHKFDLASFVKGARGDIVQKVQVTIPSIILGLSEGTYSDKIEVAGETQKDILDSSIYSLQDEKLKAQEDMKLTEAEKIKNKKLNKIKQLQLLFKEVVESNNKETDYLAKLTAEQLIVDPQYTQSFQKRVAEEEEQTRKELKWDQQYANLAKRKLQNYFIDELQSIKFRVKGIRVNTIVSSFKIKRLSTFIQNQIKLIQKIVEEEKLLEAKDKRDRTQSNFAQSKAIMEMNKLKQGKKGKEENQQVKNKIKEAQAEFEKQLALAIATKGDYKLKSSKDYVVPESERLNVSRKKKHLFLHYQYLFMEKKQFNDRLHSLKKMKIQLIKKVTEVNARIKQINKQLGQDQQLFKIQLDPQIQSVQEQIKVTQAEINEHILQKQREKQASRKTGMGGMGGQQQQDDKKANVQNVREKPPASRQQRTSLVIKPRNNLKIKQSELENQIKEIKKIKLKSQKQKLKEQMNRSITEFDNELENLRSLKYHLQSDLTLVQMKILTYAQEFIIFRDMEVYDNKLIETLRSLGRQKQQLQQKFVKLTEQINEIEISTQQVKKKYQDQKKILKQFVYPDDEDMRERIIRYYKIRERKRINKLKKQAEEQQKLKQSDNEESEGQEQQPQEQEEDQQSDDQFDDEDEKPDITVIQNDHKNFQRVRKICEYDQKIQQNGRKKSDLEKQRHQITNKIKTITTQLSKSQIQLSGYQKNKLLKVNQLNVSFPIKFSQIQYCLNVNGKLRLHQNLTSSIFFTNHQFNRLTERIQQLKKEKIQIEKKQKNLNKRLSKLIQSVNKASIEIENKKKDYEQKQLLKFGSIFQMDKLKDLQPNNQVLQMRQVFKKQEREVSNKIQSIKKQLQSKKRQLLEAKRQNTKVITQITQLGDRQNDLKKKLDSTNKQLFKSYDASKKDELQKERQNLKDLIKFLSKEIDDLRTQIGLFKRKGGHIYTMVTSNKKNFS